MELKFRLTLTSDYHVGAGHGLGTEIDSALLRDGDGVPVLRGTLLAGLLRDGLRELFRLPELAGHQRCRDSGSSSVQAPEFCDGTSPCPLCRILGAPALAKRWQISSARPEEARRPQSERWQAGAEGSRPAQRVRVNPRTRRAEARKLFSREEGDGRLHFIFTATCPGEDAATKADAALLLAAARMVRYLGGSRRRGRGECSLHLEDKSQESDLLSLFRTRWLENQSVPASVPQPAVWQAPQAEGGPVRLRLIVRTDEPLVLAERGEAGNQLATLDYIPGTALLGAFAARAAAIWDLTDPESELYRAFVRVFRRGGVRFPALWLAERQASSLYPCIPAPLDLLSCQLCPGFTHARGHGITGWARQDQEAGDCPECRKAGIPDIPLKPLGGYVTVRTKPRRLEPQEREEMHPRLDFETKRVRTGELFGYTALETGQYFAGELCCASEADWQTLCRLAGLPGEKKEFSLRVGRACRRGYGLVRAWLERVPGDQSPWSTGLPLKTRITDLKETLTLTLLSDAVLVDDWGRCRQTLSDLDWLAGLVGTAVQVRNCYCAARVVDTFNQHLGLPRWRDVALRAGSAVGFVLVEPFDATQVIERLHHLEQEGLGLRRDEGFGRVAFNHPIYGECAQVGDTSIPIPQPLRLESGGASTPALVEARFERRWDNRLAGLEARLFEDGFWEAVAGWIRTQAPQGVQAVRDGLNNWGEPGNLGQPQRGKSNAFAVRGEEGNRQLLALLDELEREPEGTTHRQRGLEMLADRIAALVKNRRPGAGGN
jgi:CRISPR-associated protein Csx10